MRFKHFLWIRSPEPRGKGQPGMSLPVPQDGVGCGCLVLNDGPEGGKLFGFECRVINPFDVSGGVIPVYVFND